MVLLQATSLAMASVRDDYLTIVDGMADLAASRPYRVDGRLGQLDMPAIVLWGRHDPAGDPSRAVVLNRQLPRGRLVVFEDSGHLPYVEEAERFNAILADFLASVPG